MVFKSTRKGNSIYDEMKERLYRCYLLDKQSAIESVKDIEVIEDDYTFNLFQLDEIIALDKQSDECKIKFLKQKDYIEKLGISEKSKVESILTTACIINNFSNYVMNLSENKLYILICTLLSSNFKDTEKYKMLIDKFLELLKKDNTFQESNKQYIYNNAG